MSFLKKNLYRKSIFNSFFKTSRRRRKSLSLIRSEMQFVIALLLGVILAVGGTVFATSVGSNITVSGNLDVQSATATSTFAAGGINYGSGKFIIQQTSGSVGISSTTPAQALSVGGSVFIGASTGGGTAGGLGIGVATTTAGALELNGNVLFGGSASNLVNFNSANLNFNNIGTSTLPINATAWGYATSTGGANTGGAFIRFDTTNTRVGISSSTPGSTFSVQGDIQATGGFGVGAATTTPGAVEIASTTSIRGRLSLGGQTFGTTTLSIGSLGSTQGGCIEFKTPTGGTLRLIATSSGIALFAAGGC